MFLSNFSGPGGASQRSRDSGLSLGLVNDFQDDIIDEGDRQEAGDAAVSSSAKWHKHTTKVYNMLKANMAADGSDSEKPDHLSFNDLSKSVSRRTASGVFFELLQLKTWDFIELNQSDSYGDIKVRTSFVNSIHYLWW